MYETYRFLTNVWAQPWNYWEIHHHHLVSVRSSSGGEQTPKTPIERAPRSRWREKRNKERGEQKQSLCLLKKKKKKKKKKRPWHCLNSGARRAPAHCISAYMEMGLFDHPKTAIVCADSPLRTENGRPLGAEVAHMQMMRMPTCRLKPTFSFFRCPRWGRTLLTYLQPPWCVHDMIRHMQADRQPPPPPPPPSRCVTARVCARKWILNECLCSIILWGALTYWHVNKMLPLKKMWSHQGDDVELK